MGHVCPLTSGENEQVDNSNRWLSSIERATLYATAAGDVPAATRREWVREAVTALTVAQQQGHLAAREVVSRKANLSYALSRYARPQDFSDVLAPDAIVRECLALAGVAPDEADATKWTFRDADIDTMRRLRRVRHLIAPAVQLAGHVQDEQLRRQLAAWREVLPRLP